MNTDNNTVEFEKGVAGESFTLAGINNTNGGLLKKIFIGGNLADNWVKSRFPGAEIVNDAGSILNDDDIDLVIMPKTQQQPDVIAGILTTGKNVRIL